MRKIVVARDLKVYRMVLMTRTGDNLPGRQISAVVATRTKKEAQERFGITTNEMNDYAATTTNEGDVKAAMSKPGQVFAHRLDDYSDDKTYVEIVRQPHVPISRRVRKPLAPYVPKPQFTQDELELIVAYFERANSPEAAAVAEKAKGMLTR